VSLEFNDASTTTTTTTTSSSSLLAFATNCDDTEPQWPLRALNDVWNTLAAWNFLIKLVVL
jgi:hypothetical protein